MSTNDLLDILIKQILVLPSMFSRHTLSDHPSTPGVIALQLKNCYYSSVIRAKVCDHSYFHRTDTNKEVVTSQAKK